MKTIITILATLPIFLSACTHDDGAFRPVHIKSKVDAVQPATGLAGFYMMFTRIVDRYSTRIAALPQTASVWQTFPLRGWILIVCMTCLGIVLKHIPAVPAEFTASFYSGLGPMLLLAALRFLRHRKDA